MTKMPAINEAFKSYSKAHAMSKEAALTIFDVIAGMLKEGGLDAEVVTFKHPDEPFAMLIEISLPGGGVLRLSGAILYFDPFGKPWPSKEGQPS